MKNTKLIIMGIIVSGIFLLSIFYYDRLNDNLQGEKTEIGVTINGEYTETFPEKEKGLFMTDIICDQGAIGEWDEENWSFSVTNLTTTRTKCYINFKSKYKEEILNGTDPVLKEGLIPVTIREDGTVQKADICSEWYRYGNQKWANAVILEDESITYEEGEEIPESNIESYFVWIPRYRYQIFDEGKYSTYINGSSTITSYNQRILGDAMGEMGPFYFFKNGDGQKRYHNWYGDASAFVEPYVPWFARGGLFDNGLIAGQFNFVRFNGGIENRVGYRIVLN